MRTLSSLLTGGILGFGVFSGIMKLFIGFSAMTLHSMNQREMTPQNFLEHRYVGDFK